MDDFWTVMSWLIVGLILASIYSIPSYVSRGEIRFWQVFCINILLWRSLVGWVVALVIALDKSNTKVEEQIAKEDMRKLKKATIWIIAIILIFRAIWYFS